MAMKKKIVFVTKALWIGGIETALVNLLNHMDYEKYEITLLVLKAELDMLEQINPKCRVLIADRDETVTFDRKYKFNRLFHLTEEAEHPSLLHRAMLWAVPALRWVENRLYIRYIRRLMPGESFDTAVIYSDAVGETAIRAIRAERYLMFYHHGAMRRVYHDEIAYKKCKNIIAVSENQAECLRDFRPKYRNKIVAIHNLTDIEEIRRKSTVQTEELFDVRRFHIVSVGRVAQEKGMDIAVRTCAELVEKGYKDICWWLVGDGPAMQEVKNLVAELHMEDYVVMTGMKKNPYPYIRQADLYAQPSRVEAFGLTIMEAMILGKAILATNTMGACEIIDDTENGLLCRADAKIIADQIGQLIRNPERIEALERNVQEIDFHEQNQKNIALLEKLL